LFFPIAAVVCLYIVYNGLYSTVQAVVTMHYVYAKGRIRDIKDKLSEKMDAGKAADHLYQRGALNRKELDEIQRLSSDLPIKAAEQLLDILLTQTEDFYDCFLDVLMETDQLRVRQWIVLEGLFIVEYICFA